MGFLSLLGGVFRNNGYELQHYILDFNPETNKYCYYDNGKPMPYNSLPKNLQRNLDEKNAVLSENQDLIIKEVRGRNLRPRFEKLKEMGLTLESTKYGSKIPTSPIPSDFSSKLDNMFSEENVLYGIHRIGSSSDDDVLDILEHGLIITGATSSGVCKYGLDYNVGYYLDNMDIKAELLNASGFRNSKGSILIRIPDEALSSGRYLVEKDGVIRLDPRFIVGYVPLVFKVDGTVTIDKILSLSQLKLLSMNDLIDPDSDNDALDTGKKSSR